MITLKTKLGPVAHFYLKYSKNSNLKLHFFLSFTRRLVMTTATKDAVNTEAEWDRLSVIVRDTPEDFASWEQLLRVTEGTAGPYSTNTPPDKVIRMENVYDDFLNTFPLCFGYWKKYADAELAIHGIEGAVKVYHFVYKVM